MLAALGLLIWRGGAVSVPAWLIALVLLVVIIAVLTVRRQQQNLSVASEANRKRIAELEPVAALVPELERLGREGIRTVPMAEGWHPQPGSGWEELDACDSLETRERWWRHLRS